MRKFSLKKILNIAERPVAVLAGIVTILGLPLVVYQLSDLTKAKYDRSTQLLMLFDQELYSGSNPEVRHAIDRGGPILEENGGHIAPEQVGDYLDVFEALSDANEHHLIDYDMLYNYDSDYIEKAYMNKEVQAYIADVRKEDTDFYSGFEELAKQFLKDESSHR